MMTMPTFPVETIVDGWDSHDADLVRAAFTSRGARDGLKLRASKPFKRVRNSFEGYANYVWRMLCFDLVGWGKHACMPVCADIDVSIPLLGDGEIIENTFTPDLRAHYYRIVSPAYAFEYDNTQNDASHIHAVWRDFAGDFGRDLLRSHYQQQHAPVRQP